MVSSADDRFNGISVDPIEIWIEDDDCDVLVGPRHGAILGGCSNQYGDRCVVECDVGHAPAGGVVLECEAGTGTWNGSVPSCAACLTGYFHMDTNGSCAACNASACGVGMYRGACGASSDAVCEACTSKPANASYLTSGQPWHADNCTWQCDVGFWRSGESCVSCNTSSCGAGQYRGACEAEADAPAAPEGEDADGAEAPAATEDGEEGTEEAKPEEGAEGAEADGEGHGDELKRKA